MRNTNSNINFLSYSGIKYVPFPCNFDFFDEVINVPIDDLATVVAKVLSLSKYKNLN